jgi:D-alanyl-D-alanine carboxypeptidase/D-alanyl-D-alanine-endopeptidase (penicillin-binding protein 4)
VAKVFTAALALHRLGPDRRIPTTVSLSPDRKTLVVASHGDPLLTASHLRELARCVAGAGVKQIERVRVVLDPFTAASVPPAFDEKKTDQAFRAGVAGFQVDLNAVEVRITPGKAGEKPAVEVLPASARTVVNNDAVTGGGKAKKGAKKERLSVTQSRDAEGRLVITVRGTVVRKGVSGGLHRVPDPADHAAGVFESALEGAGVAVSAPFEFGPAVDGAKELCRHESVPIREILGPMLRDSLNPVAETLLRLAGAEGAPGPVGFEEGATALGRFLQDPIGLKPAEFRFRNGSGLYDANRTTARAVVKLLASLKREAGLAAALDGLPKAGVEGTLKKRFRKTALEGKLRAKTGTLDSVVALAGVADLPDGRTLQFAILTEGKDLDRAGCRKAIDAAVLRAWEALAGREKGKP